MFATISIHRICGGHLEWFDSPEVGIFSEEASKSCMLDLPCKVEGIAPRKDLGDERTHLLQGPVRQGDDPLLGGEAFDVGHVSRSAPLIQRPG